MKHNHTLSIKNRLLLPVAVILLFQAVFLFVFYQSGGVVHILRNNAVHILAEDTRHRQINLERTLATYHSSINQAAKDIPPLVERLLLEQGRSSAEIADSPELNRAIVNDLTEPLLNLLHHSQSNGAFLVLSGPAAAGDSSTEHAGLFLRDTDASSFASDNSDLLLVRGLPSIARRYQLALDPAWTLGFCLEHEENSGFYRNPFELAYDLDIPYEHASGCAYMGVMSLCDSKFPSCLAYSVPLILSDGAVIGVVGCELSSEHIRQLLWDDMDKIDQDTFTLLASSTGDDQSFLPAIAANSQLRSHFDTDQPISYQPSKWDSVYTLQDLYGESWYASIEPLEIYPGNTPFAQEQWMVVHLQPEDALFASTTSVQRVFLLAELLSLICSFLALIAAGRAIVNPIERLTSELRQFKPGSRPTLQKIKIQEIDTLVDEINRLNDRVIKQASTVSRVLNTLDVEIGVFEYDTSFGEVFCSSSLLKLMGHPQADDQPCFMRGASFQDMLSELKNPTPDDGGMIYEFQRGGELRYIRMRLTETAAHESIGVLMDVTAELNERHRLEQERNVDHLTGLYNHRSFQERVRNLLSSGRVQLALVVMWDIDNLKYVNDTYGHDVGDHYIRLFAEHLRTLGQTNAIVERRSGDEFTAVLHGGTEEALMDRVGRFMDGLAEITLETPDGDAIPLRASAGIACYPRHGRSFEELIRYADFAMYMSKHNNKGIAREFDPAAYHSNAYLLSGHRELNQILEDQCVQFALQPIVTRSGDVYGYELLMRPPLEKLKNISELLHLAKLQAKLPQFEDLTWRQGFKWIAEREQTLAPNAKFFINSIASTALDDDAVDALETSFPQLLNRIVCELTETEESSTACHQFKQQTLRRWGAALALDDYGTGYNNDTALLRLEPNIVKLDLALVRNIHSNLDQQVIAKHLVLYCHERSIQVLAEGVETEEEMRFLMGIQIDLFQGYYIARPSIEPPVLSRQAIEAMRSCHRHSNH